MAEERSTKLWLDPAALSGVGSAVSQPVRHLMHALCAASAASRPASLCDVCCACSDTPVGQPKVATSAQHKASAIALTNPASSTSTSTAQPSIALLPSSHRALWHKDDTQAASGAAVTADTVPGHEQVQEG